ncbi:MAG: efflux RND transporter periplasmic adaptor subunit [Candidatus Omnitrophica bacterium]|nr:efflux RND transporter periplasmic adaptor subunit [Candidatus Omnitrophota bacterium]
MKNNLMKVLLGVFIVLSLALSASLYLALRMNLKPGPAQARKILYYRNPMKPQVTSLTPMKDEMGMDYTPVYEEEQSVSREEGVYISPEKQQLVNIKTEKAGKRKLVKQLLVAGKVAYDPDLYVAEEEYLQAREAQAKMLGNTSSIMKQEIEGLAEAARKKLLLQGMSEQEIGKLTKRNAPDGNLYLPLLGDKAWIYLPVYEYEAGAVKNGMVVEIEAVSFPGESFTGKISSVGPVLDENTRTVLARAQVKNPEHKLKPGMFVSARIKIDLGEKLAVPEEAVMDTGERQVVFVAKPSGYFESRELKLGEKAEGFYEVLSGLQEGESVVSSGNFFVDSETALK